MNPGMNTQHEEMSLLLLWQATVPHVSRPATLDWLCLALQPDELPRAFAGGAHSAVAADGIKLLAASDVSRAAAASEVR